MKTRIGKGLARAGATVLALVLSMLAAASGCGRAVPQPAAASDSGPSAEQLGLQVLSAGSDTDIPGVAQSDSAVDGTGETDRVYEGDEVMFVQTIALPVPGEALAVRKPIFFVWPQAGDGYSIDGALYSIRMLNDLNQVGGEPKVSPASFDPQTRRWFIPFSDLFPGGVAVDPATLYSLRLDLQIHGRDPIHVTVEFRVLGSLPHIDVEPAATDVPIDPLSFVQASAAEGYVIRRERITNPSSHPVWVWAQSNSGSLALTSIIDVSQRNTGPVLDVRVDHKFSSTANFGLDQLWIHRASASEPISIQSGEWHSIPLAAHEALFLEWVAHALPGTPRCSLPPDVNQSIVPFVRYRVKYTLADAGMSGPWRRILEVTDPRQDPRGAIRIARIDSEFPFTLPAVGDPGSEDVSGPFSCQGLF